MIAIVILLCLLSTRLGETQMMVHMDCHVASAQDEDGVLFWLSHGRVGSPKRAGFKNDYIWENLGMATTGGLAM